MATTNCYTLSRSAVEVGIAISEPAGKAPRVNIGPDHAQTVIYLGLGAEGQPSYSETLLLKASIARVGSHLRFVHAQDWDGLLLRVIVRDLNFRAEPFAEKMNLNPGGEGVPPIVQRGPHRDTVNKDQIFCLENGQHIFVIDHKRAVMKVTCRRGIPVLQVATREQLVAYITLYGLSARGHPEISWAAHTVRTLTGAIPQQLEARMRSFATK